MRTSDLKISCCVTAHDYVPWPADFLDRTLLGGSFVVSVVISVRLRAGYMTRREGVLRVNLLAPVAVLFRREAGHRYSFDTRQSSIARDPTDRFA